MQYQVLKNWLTRQSAANRSALQIPFNWEKYWEFWKIDPVQSAVSHTFPSCNQQLLMDWARLETGNFDTKSWEFAQANRETIDRTDLFFAVCSRSSTATVSR
jgi:hypothetical protein